MRILRLLPLLLFSTPAFATWYTSGSWSTTPDEGTYEVLGGACDDWSGTANSSLSNTVSGTWDWVNWMGTAGYTHYEYGTNKNAWSIDWESGTDNSYADAADFAYVSTHGASNYIAFNGSSGDNVVTSADTQWGDGDDEAIAIDACYVLDSAGRSALGTANKNDGIHYIFGFQSLSDDITTTADYYGMYMELGYSLKSAWKYATQAGHDSSRTGAYVRFYKSTCDTSTDTAYSTSCDPKSSSSYATSTWTL